MERQSKAMKRSLGLSFMVVAALLLIAATSFDRVSASAPAPVTFSKDIAPIFFNKCAACHRPGEIGGQ